MSVPNDSVSVVLNPNMFDVNTVGIIVIKVAFVKIVIFPVDATDNEIVGGDNRRFNAVVIALFNAVINVVIFEYFCSVTVTTKL
jgi:hypothetical protein